MQKMILILILVGIVGVTGRFALNKVKNAPVAETTMAPASTTAMESTSTVPVRHMDMRQVAMADLSLPEIEQQINSLHEYLRREDAIHRLNTGTGSEVERQSYYQAIDRLAELRVRHIELRLRHLEKRIVNAQVQK
jgi:hypothetical protein